MIDIKFTDLEVLEHLINTMRLLINDKVDKEDGKGLSSEDYSPTEKEKLFDIEEGANKYIHPEKHSALMIEDDSLHRFVSDEEKQTWNDKPTHDDIDNAVGDMVGLPPETLNSLDKLAKAIGDDPNFVSTITVKINNKVDKVEGMGLSTNDYTTSEKSKLELIEDKANNYTHPESHPASMILEDESKRFVSDDDKLKWDSKAEVDYVDSEISDLNNTLDATIDDVISQINNKVDTEEGKGLSTNDYTDKDKAKNDIIQLDGNGEMFLSNDGKYKEITSDDSSIDDENISSSTTYSSEKINNELKSKSNTDHTHEGLSDIDGLKQASHSHDNKDVVDNITLEKVTEWEEKTDRIITTGDGKKYLSDDGSYKTIEGNSGGGSGGGIAIWTYGKSYEINDFVCYEDMIYRCIVSPQEDLYTFNEEEWVSMASKIEFATEEEIENMINDIWGGEDINE